MGQHYRLAALLAVGWALTGGLRADETPTAEAVAPAAAVEASTDDAFKFFLQEAEVVTASRRAQKKSDSPVAIDVITREDIQKSGALNIWDLLRFRVGIDMTESASIEGNAVQLNVRGLPSEFSQSLQVLLDGRSVVSGVNSGVFWRNLPVALDEIERIEIVRGPNSALFGANAGQGVINIITVKPTGNGRGWAKTQAGQFGQVQSGASLEFGGATSAHRLSFQHRKIGSGPTPDGSTSIDLNGTSMDERFNGRSSLRLWEGGEVELFGGASERRFRVSNPPGPLNSGGLKGDAASNQETYAMLQVHQALGDHSFELNLSRKDALNGYALSTVNEMVNDVDALGRINLMDGAAVTTLGGSLRYIQAKSSFLFNFNGYGDGGDEESNRLGRLYGAQSLNATDWLTLSVAGSAETSDIGGAWPAYQGAVILKPLEGHSLRLSGSKSPTMPSLQASRGDIIIQVAAPAFIPLGPPFTPKAGGGTFPIGIVADGIGAGPAQVASYEATLASSFLDRRISTEFTAFQMEIDGLINLDGRPAPLSGYPNFGAGGDYAPLGGDNYALIPGGYVVYANSSSLVLRGVESAITFKPVAGTSIQVNHTYEDVYYQNPSDPNDPFSKEVTPWNKVNVLVASELPWGFNVSSQLGWVGKHVSYQASRGQRGWIEDQGKLDLRLGYKPTPDVELFAAGLNLDHAYRTEGMDGTAVPQMYYGGLNLAWGGK